MKRLLCLLLCLFLIIIPFSITASADDGGIIDAALMAVDYIYDCVTGANRVSDLDTEEFREYCYSGEWFSDNIGLFNALPSTVGMIAAQHEINKMKDSDYACMQLNKDQLRQLQNAANSAVSGYGKTANYSSLSDYNLQYYGGFATNGIIQLGSGGPIFYLGNSYNMYTAKVSQAYYLQSTSNTDISIFSGSSGFPVFFVPSNGVLYQNGIALPSNYWYVPLSSSELIQIQPNTPYLSCFFTSQDTLESVTFEFLFVNYHADSDSFTNNLRLSSCSVFSNGSLIGQIGDESFPGSLVVDRLEKMVGTRINYDGKPTIEPFELPSDIPYDDNDEVVVCVPMGDGNSGEVVYLSPTEYNNYITNGDIVTNDNRVSDYHDEQTINNISNVVNNITNNYGSSYDDTNLLNKLEKWFSDISKKLDEIKDKIGTGGNGNGNLFNFDFGNDWDDDLEISDSVEVDFNDLINAKLPIIKEVKSIINKLRQQNRPLVIHGPNPAVALLDPLGIDTSEMNKTFSVDFSWYDQHISGDLDITPRLWVRDGLKYIAYAIGLVHVYRKSKQLLEEF